MNNKRYLQILVYFAKADNDHDETEWEFIRQVGRRLGIDDSEIELILDSDPNWEPELPESEVERFILFDDILDLIAADNKLTDREEDEARKIAKKLGFMPSMVDAIFINMRRQIENGHPLNKMSKTNDSSVSKSTHYGKYNQ